MNDSVLITGASGLVGTRLTEILLESGYRVAHLGRKKRSQKDVESYTWDIQAGFVEPGALENANIVIHLAGAGVADQRWTENRKKVIPESRVQSTRLLYDKLKALPKNDGVFISASAIGIYGWDTGDQWVDENAPKGEGFLADVTEAWEQEINRLNELDMRVVMMRIGIVLSDKGGALSKIAPSVRYYAGAPLGSGQQYMSWIHIDDLCNMFVKAIEDVNLSGAYNAVAPNPVTNQDFMKSLAKVMNKKLWLPSVPSWALNLITGEMGQMLIGGNRVSSKRIVSTGFNFKFAEVEETMRSLLK